ncbi:hypothetical protein DYGSA30_21920 [Dyella sp. GSA-30]|nr:hypothetical protein DYGSA30_21920 [Dyella sp. GSA-30]
MIVGNDEGDRFGHWAIRAEARYGIYALLLTRHSGAGRNPVALHRVIASTHRKNPLQSPLGSGLRRNDDRLGLGIPENNHGRLAAAMTYQASY